VAYSIRTLRLKPDYEGEVVATLVGHPATRPSRQAVLYVHGFVDYFFQDHLAQHFSDAGYNFFALDLRKYGRSLLSHQHPNYCRSLDEYFEDLDSAIEAIQACGNTRLILMGHSTGGLITTLYASSGRHADKVQGLVLNSPFFEFNIHPALRFLMPVVANLARPFRYAGMSKAVSPLYAQSLLHSYGGEWDFNLAWKPLNGFPAFFRWLLAVRAGQRRLKRGLQIACPVLLMHAARSFIPREWSEDIKSADVVLNVEDMKRLASRLGPRCSLYEVEDGIHDLTLSRPDVRQGVLDKMVHWSDEVLGC
jgi:alpha-beta hydrolase superfamily lysophospholipase